MKLQFDANQEYQLKAIESAVNVFKGQADNSVPAPFFRRVAVRDGRIDIGADEFGCEGDLSADGWVNSTDVDFLVAYLETYGGFFWVVPRTDENWDEKYNFNGDDWVNSTDVGFLVAYINTYGGFPWAIECPGPGM